MEALRGARTGIPAVPCATTCLWAASRSALGSGCEGIFSTTGRESLQVLSIRGRESRGAEALCLLDKGQVWSRLRRDEGRYSGGTPTPHWGLLQLKLL